MEAVEAVEATQFCGGANGASQAAAPWRLLVSVFSSSGQVDTFKITGRLQHRFAGVPPASTGSSVPSAFAERVCKIQIPLTRHPLPILLRIQFPIPLLCVQSVFIYLSSSPFSLDRRP